MTEMSAPAPPPPVSLFLVVRRAFPLLPRSLHFFSCLSSALGSPGNFAAFAKPLEDFPQVRDNFRAQLKEIAGDWHKFVQLCDCSSFSPVSSDFPGGLLGALGRLAQPPALSGATEEFQKLRKFMEETENNEQQQIPSSRFPVFDSSCVGLNSGLFHLSASLATIESPEAEAPLLEFSRLAHSNSRAAAVAAARLIGRPGELPATPAALPALLNERDALEFLLALESLGGAFEQEIDHSSDNFWARRSFLTLGRLVAVGNFPTLGALVQHKQEGIIQKFLNRENCNNKQTEEATNNIPKPLPLFPESFSFSCLPRIFPSSGFAFSLPAFLLLLRVLLALHPARGIALLSRALPVVWSFSSASSILELCAALAQRPGQPEEFSVLLAALGDRVFSSDFPLSPSLVCRFSYWSARFFHQSGAAPALRNKMAKIFRQNEGKRKTTQNRKIEW